MIRAQHCPRAEALVTDGSLSNEYMKAPSVKGRLKRLRNTFRRYKLKKGTQENIIKDIADLIIPPGTKASLRGLTFNKYVKRRLQAMMRRNTRYSLTFEKKHPDLHEIPDWSLTHNRTQKVLVGYNQLDLWNGGSQLNRAGKYIFDDVFHERHAQNKIKVVSIVARKTIVSKNNFKLFRVFYNGFGKDRLFYIKGALTYIKTWMDAVEKTK
jgi:hypothetical protein